jgi:hypothetical protein
MAQPGSVPPPLEPTPFGNAPQPGPARRGGCGKPVMIGCAALLVLLGIAAILVVANARRFSGALLSWSLGNLEKQIFATMPQDVTAEEREHLRTAFGSALAAIRSGRFDPQRLPEVQSEIMQIARSQGKITREDVLDLTQALEAIAASAPPGEQPAPAGATEPAPAPA